MLDLHRVLFQVSIGLTFLFLEHSLLKLKITRVQLGSKSDISDHMLLIMINIAEKIDS